MTKSLTDVDSFATITVPEDADTRNAASVETPFQLLANRTRNSKNRLDVLSTYALFQLSGTKASAALFDLTELIDSPGGFSIASSAIVFPAIGTYSLNMNFRASSNDATDNIQLGVEILLNGVSAAFATQRRYSTDTSHVISAGYTNIFNIADLATDRLTFKSFVSNTTVLTDSRILIRRLA